MGGEYDRLEVKTSTQKSSKSPWKNRGTVKVPKWIHFSDEWIQALSQWAARIFLIFKNERKYCILIGLELYPFTSKVYPFGAFTGKRVIRKIHFTCFN